MNNPSQCVGSQNMFFMNHEIGQKSTKRLNVTQPAYLPEVILPGSKIMSGRQR